MASTRNRHKALFPSLETKLKVFWLVALLPVALLFTWLGLALEFSTLGWITAGLVLGSIYLSLGVYAFNLATQPFYNLINQAEAVRLEDYSLRARPPVREGLLAEVYQEFDRLSQSLQQRKGKYDQNMFLLYRLIEVLESPVILLDHRHCLAHANPASQAILGQSWLLLKGRGADQFGLRQEKGYWQLEHAARGVWQIRQSSFRDGENDYQLLIFNNIEKEIQRTERDAWQNIVRVLNHEVRNSLTPILSLTQDLLQTSDLKQSRHREALEVVQSRGHALLKFIESYAILTKIPRPAASTINLAELLSSIATLTNVQAADIDPNLCLEADRAQLEQVLINLIKNAKEASQENATVILKAYSDKKQIVLQVIDAGHGLSNSENLFTPFYTTKAGGCGIGLALSRQIIRNHGGELRLENRQDGVGAVATILI